jgi:secreted trypsin-like serine protease
VARVSHAILALTLCACGSPSGDAGEPLGRVAQAVTNGNDDDGDSEVVVLVQGEGDDEVATCSGTLIAPLLVVTAAHCFEPSAPTGVHFGSTPGDGGPTVAVAEVAAHPSFDAVTYANDIGVVVLAAAAPVAPTAWRSTPLEASLVGATVRIVGFGVDSSSGDGSRQKRTGTTTVNAEAAESFDFGADPSMTCFGDSGGPAFATIDGQEVLVGVTSTGDPACAAWGRDTRVDAYASFVGAFSSSGLGQGTSHGCGLGGSAGGTPATSAIAIVSLLAVRRSRRARRATRESAAEAA